MGVTLYRPYGLQWFDQGYYNIYGDLRKKDPARYLAKKYLEDTIYTPLLDNQIGYGIGQETYNGCEDYPIFNLLTLDQAKNTQIDIVICSLHENEQSFAKLKEFWPNAKFIRQVGNDLDTNIDSNLYPNLLSSAKAPFQAFQGHKILYKQEWDINLSQYQTPTNFNNIYSFQNNLEAFEDTFEVWVKLKHQLRDFNFKSYGNENDNGKIYPKREYYQKMSESTFGFQSKGPYEGYGFCIWNSYWLGRPMILKFSDYQGKIAEPLLIKDETYLEMTDPDLIEKIRYYSDPKRFKIMSLACKSKFEEMESFDSEFETKIKPFFSNLV